MSVALRGDWYLCGTVRGALPGRVSPDEGRELVLDAVPKMTGFSTRGTRKLLEG